MNGARAETGGEERERYWYDHILAVVCGVSSYGAWQQPEGCGLTLPDLVGVPESVRRMQAWLKDSLGAEVIQTPDPANATAAEIVQCIEDLRLRLADEAREGRRLAALVYLAGHALEQGTTAHFLAAREAGDRYFARDKVWLGRIRSEFVAMLSQAYHLLFIVDCCHAGHAVPPQAGATDGRLVRDCLRYRAVQIAVACRARQLAGCDPEQGMLFTRAFLDQAERVEVPGIPLSMLMAEVRRDASVELQFPYFWSQDAQGGEFVVGLPTRARVAPRLATTDETIEGVLQLVRRLFGGGVELTRLDLVNWLRRRGHPHADVAVDRLIQNGQLAQRYDDYLYLRTPVESKPEEQQDGRGSGP